MVPALCSLVPVLCYAARHTRLSTRRSWVAAATVATSCKRQRNNRELPVNGGHMLDGSANLDDDVLDESEAEIVPYRYSITSYGADYPVDGLVKRLGSEVIFVPSFQRSYVWSLPMASRFIESLLLGLPVPGIFLSKEPDSGKMLVIDGHQRLKSLQFFYDGIFGGKEFRLQGVQARFESRTIKTIEEEDRIRLDDSIIHATVVKQDEPSNDQSSIFHIFERLNTGGMQLQSQEIRACIFHGPFNDLLRKLNNHRSWRQIYGPPSKRLKDQELILRFFALYFYFEEYERPIKEFLNKYMGANRKLNLHRAGALSPKFNSAIEFVAEAIGKHAFRPERALNASVFDAVMVGIARRLEKGVVRRRPKLREAYEALLANEQFLATIRTGTSDVPNVRTRIDMATASFQNLR